METTNLPPMPDLSAQQPDTGNSNQGHKKALLQKLMSNLLGKPGRSMHEIIDGVKQAIGAYKNYAKEWDTLNGAVQGATVGGAAGAAVGAAGSTAKNSVQDIMKQIQAQKAQQNTPTPTPLPRMPQPMQAKQAPQATAVPNMYQRMGMPQPTDPNVIGKPGPTNLAQMMQQSPGMFHDNMPVTRAPSANDNMPVTRAPSANDNMPIMGQPQTSTFNRPAPVSNLGIHGF